jgi:hypothetical protein
MTNSGRRRLFCDRTDQPASPRRDRRTTPISASFALSPSMCDCGEEEGLAWVPCPGLGNGAGPRNSGPLSGQETAFVSHTLVPGQGRRGGMIGGQEEAREAGWLVSGRLVTGGGQLFVSKAGNMTDSTHQQHHGRKQKQWPPLVAGFFSSDLVVVVPTDQPATK